MGDRPWLFLGTGVLCLAVAALAGSSLRWPGASWAWHFAARHPTVAAPRRRRVLAWYAVGYGVAGACWLLAAAVRAGTAREGGAGLLPAVADAVMLLCLGAAVRSLGKAG